MLSIQEKVKALRDPSLVNNIMCWLSSYPTQKDIEELALLIDTDLGRLNELFGTSLSFGTAGLRSLMGIGTNRINTFTVRKATQGLAQVLKRTYANQDIKVIVGYDTRHNSLLFAQETSKVLAGNQIHALLFKTPQPLGLISFSVRRECACAGVMITASHNPPSYNGYKVYMSTGGQVLPPFDQELMDEFQTVESILISDHLSDPYIHMIGEDQEEDFLRFIRSVQLFPEYNRQMGNLISLSYSPLHGAGTSLLPKALKACSFSRVQWVESQMIPDGNFSTVSLPNPEEKEALRLGIQQMLDNKEDLFIATDPDVDRLGVVCCSDGQPYIFNGNQIACLLLDHILGAWSKKLPIGKEHKVVKSVVTSELLTAIVKHYGGSMIQVGTGFKYIGEQIEYLRKDLKQGVFVFGAEESYGYLYGNAMEDKDAVSASVLLVEKALQEKLKGKTLRDRMLELYDLYGYFMNCTQSFAFDFNELEKIQSFLDQLEKVDLTHIMLGNQRIKAVENYMQGVGRYVQDGSVYTLCMPKMRMICYHLENGGRIIVRPSGTEPKMKLYFETVVIYALPAQNKEEMLIREQDSQLCLNSLVSDFHRLFLNDL